MHFTTAIIATFAALAAAAPAAVDSHLASDATFKSTLAANKDTEITVTINKALFKVDSKSNVPVSTPEDKPLKKRQTIGLYICQDLNFSGRCENLISEEGQCYNLYNGWNDQVTSLGPDNGAVCTVYDDYGCVGGRLGGIVNPGIYNLGDYGWNDRFSSYRCYFR